MAEYNVVEFQLGDPAIRTRLARRLIELGVHVVIDELIKRVRADEILLHDAVIVGAVLINEPEEDFEKWTRGYRKRLEELCPQYCSPYFSRAPLQPLAQDQIVMDAAGLSGFLCVRSG